MRLTKEEMIAEMVCVAGELSGYLSELKIREGHLDINDRLHDLKASDIKLGHDWLIKIHGKEFQSLRKARNLLPPEQWKRYELFGDAFDEHQEVIILRKAQVELRKVLVCQNRPNVFKKGWVNEQLDEKDGKENNKCKGNGSDGEESGVHANGLHSHVGNQ